jgi:K+-sensing histidine kinase KdpD
MPLVRLRQNLSNLIEADENETRFRQATDELTNQVGDISLLLENLLQWSKFQSQGIRAKPQYIDINALANEGFNQQKYGAAERKIALCNNLNHGLFVYADEEMTRCSLKAILQNMVRLSESGSTISVSGDKDGRSGRLLITFAGCMPQKQMFLQQSDADSYGTDASELGKAVSLGWMLCRALMKANNGNIRIEDANAETFSIIMYFALEKFATTT